VPRAGVVTRLTGRRLPVYELAHSNDLEELRSREWTFLRESIHREMPETLLPGTHERFHWILAYFTQLLLELDHANASNPATRPSFSLQQVDDNGDGGDTYSSEDDEFGNGMYGNTGGDSDAAARSPPNGSSGGGGGYMYDPEEEEEGDEEEQEQEELEDHSAGAGRSAYDAIVSSEGRTTNSSGGGGSGGGRGAAGKLGRTPPTTPLTNGSGGGARYHRQQEQQHYQHQHQLQQLQQLQHQYTRKTHAGRRAIRNNNSSSNGSSGNSNSNSRRRRRRRRSSGSQRIDYEQTRAPPAITNSGRRARSSKFSRGTSSRRLQSSGNGNSIINRGSHGTTAAVRLRSPKRRRRRQEIASHVPRHRRDGTMSRYAMRIAIQRRDNILLMIGMNALVWFLRSNIVLENITPGHFYIALGVANVLLLCRYLMRYCRLSAAFAALLSNPAEVLSTPLPRSRVTAAVCSGGSEDERDDVDESRLEEEDEDGGRRGELEEEELDDRGEDEDVDTMDEDLDSEIEPLDVRGGGGGGGSGGARRRVTRDSDGKVLLGDTISRVEEKVRAAVGMECCWLLFLIVGVVVWGVGGEVRSTGPIILISLFSLSSLLSVSLSLSLALSLSRTHFVLTPTHTTHTHTHTHTPPPPPSLPPRKLRQTLPDAVDAGLLGLQTSLRKGPDQLLGARARGSVQPARRPQLRAQQTQGALAPIPL
jgi:hypothetical protein